MLFPAALVVLHLLFGCGYQQCCIETYVDQPRSYCNRLAREKIAIPFAAPIHNPVDWYAWGDEAFAKAREENKPIFLSIGYSTCHWCHVMERESFEDENVAAFHQ